MYLQAIANALPAQVLTQRECWDLFAKSESRKHLRQRSVQLARGILLGESGVEKRHFAAQNLDRVFELDAQDLNQIFEREAPVLARTALLGALEKAHMYPREIDALLICTCTGYICPGITSYVAEQMNMRRNTYLQDIVGLGCGAAIPTLRGASHFLSAHPEGTVAVIAVEICSAAFYIDDDPGVIISACLFGDGASASIWSMNTGRTGLQCTGFDFLHFPEDRELLRFVNRFGKLRNLLHKTVPEKAAVAVKGLYRNLKGTRIGQVISHSGGRDVLQAIERALPAYKLKESASVLRKYGNMSSPSVLFAFEEYMDNNTIDEDLWLTAFGAGFSCHSCRISRS